MILAGSFAGLFQDLFLGLELYILLGLLNRIIGNKLRTPKTFFCIISIILFSLIHIYLILDVFLLFDLGINFNYNLFYLIRYIPSFWDSAKDLGLAFFLLVSIAVIAVSIVSFSIYFKRFEAPSLSQWSIYALCIIPFMAILLQKEVPFYVRYYTNNLIIDEQYSFVKNISGIKKSLIHEITRKDILSILPGDNIEKFDFISKEFPILKLTKGFSGQKNFSINVDENEKPHIIFLFLESFRAFDVGVLGSDKKATPVFDRLSKEGVLFTNFYSTGAQTTRAVISSLYGIMPRFTEQSVQSGDPGLSLIGIADILNKKGYKSAFFHNGSLQFERKDIFFPRHGYSEIFGKDEITANLPDVQKTSWGVHDEYLMRFAANWLDKKDREGQPVFMTMFTVSTHHPYNVPENYQPPDFKILRNDPFDPISNRRGVGMGMYKKYLETINYADHCLGLFISLLKEKGVLEKSIIFILADSSVPMGEHFGNYFGIRYLYEENIKIPLLIFAAGRLKKPAVVEQVSSQVDLLPTVMDILNIHTVNHSIGSSLVRRDTNRAVFFENPFEMKYRGIRKGDYKFIYTKHDGKVIAQLYNLKNDPAETCNLADRYDLSKAFYQETEKCHLIFKSLYENRNFAPGSIQFPLKKAGQGLN